MTVMELNDIIEWLSIEENVNKLNKKEQGLLFIAMHEYEQKVKEIVIPHMIESESTTFLFKM